MLSIEDVVAAAWRDGVGPDDREVIASVVAPPAGDASLELFAALCALVSGERVPIRPAPMGPAAAVVHAAAVVLDAVLSRHPAAIERAVAVMAHALELLPDRDPHAVAAVAWADLALGDVAVFVGDLRAAGHRYDSVAQPDRPLALRIAAMLRLGGVALERRDLDAARGSVRKAEALAVEHRPVHATRAHLVRGLLDYAVGDLTAVRETLGTGDHGPITRLLLATVEPGPEAMQLFADALAEAVATRDPIAYALCVLVGSRRYIATGRDADALVTIDRGIAELADVAPHLANALCEERRNWVDSWGPERFAAADTAARNI